MINIIKFAVIIILLISLILIGTFYIENKTDYFDGEIQKIVELYANDEKKECQEKMKKFKKEWEQSFSVFSIIVSHNELEKADISVEKIMEWLKNDKSEEFYVEAAVLRFTFAHINKIQTLHMGNVL